MTGVRNILVTGRTAFDDRYNRAGLLLRAQSGPLQLQAEQWWGHDDNADGFGSAQGSSGGYARLKYYVTPHSYLAVRYDAAANPAILRDMVYYGALMVTPHARLVVQDVQTIGGSSNLGAAVTIAFPWPPGL
jgi:hypothetical protein